MPVSAFLLLYGIFLFDATVTLGRRWLIGERWWEAHAAHFYQRVARSGDRSRAGFSFGITWEWLSC